MPIQPTDYFLINRNDDLKKITYDELFSGLDGGPPVTINESAPADPTAGDLWWADDDDVEGGGRLYLWTGTEWVDVSIPYGGGDGADIGCLQGPVYIAPYPGDKLRAIGGNGRDGDTNLFATYAWSGPVTGTGEYLYNVIPGTYTVTATISCSSGGTLTTTDTYVVEEPPAGVINFNPTITDDGTELANTPDHVLTASALDIVGGNDPVEYQYRWRLDGDIIDDTKTLLIYAYYIGKTISCDITVAEPDGSNPVTKPAVYTKPIVEAGTINTPTVLAPLNGDDYSQIETRNLISNSITNVEGGGTYNGQNYDTKLTVSGDKDLEDMKPGDMVMSDGTPAGGEYDLKPYKLVTTDIESVDNPTVSVTQYTIHNGGNNFTAIPFDKDDFQVLTADYRSAALIQTVNFGNVPTASSPQPNPLVFKFGGAAVAGIKFVFLGVNDTHQKRHALYGSQDGMSWEYIGEEIPFDKVEGIVSGKKYAWYALYQINAPQENNPDAFSGGMSPKNFGISADSNPAITLIFPGAVSTNPDLQYFKPGDEVQSGVTVIGTGYEQGQNTMIVDGGTWAQGDVVEYQTNGGKGKFVIANTIDKTIMLSDDPTATRDNRWIAENKAGTDFYVAGGQKADDETLTADIRLQCSEFATTPENADTLNNIIWEINGTEESAGTVNPYKPSNLQTNTTYTVRAKHQGNSLDDSEFSNPVTFTTGATRNIREYYQQKIDTLQSRIASIEADEVNDDATDTALLTLLANLATRVTNLEENN